MPFYTYLKNEKPKTKKNRVVNNLCKLREQLEEHITSSRTTIPLGSTVRICTWNLREFGGKSYGGRTYEELYYIAEIISHFDIIALQEVQGDLEEFRDLMKYLGPGYKYIATDVTDGYAGNGERMIFLYNREKVFFRNIAGELTLKEGSKIRASFGERIKMENGLQLELPNGVDLSGEYDGSKKSKSGGKALAKDLHIDVPVGSKLIIPDGSRLVLKKGMMITDAGRGRVEVDVPTGQVEGEDFGLRLPDNSFDDSLRQFARTPFIIAFQSGWLKLNLCTVHIYYGEASGEKLEQRRREIELLTASLASKAKAEFKADKDTFLGVLGDFNIVGKGHPTMEALESNGFEIPEILKDIPGTNVKRDKAYDQIAFWKPGRNTGYSRLDIIGANVFDFFEHVYTESDENVYRAENGNGLEANDLFTTWRTYKMSDHLPMWVEIRTDFNDEYLESINT